MDLLKTAGCAHFLSSRHQIRAGLVEPEVSISLETLVPLCDSTTSSVLGRFGHAHQRRPEGASVKLVAHFGYYGDGARLFPFHRGVEESFVLVGIKLLAFGVKPDQAVLVEHLLDLDLRHHQAVVQVLQVRVLARHLLLGYALRGLLQDVSHLQQIFAKALDP